MWLRKEVVVMRLLLDTTAVSFQVTRAAEARKDYGKDVQKVDRDTGQPQWAVEVLAQDSERGEVIKVTVTGDQPKVTPGQQVRFEALEAIPWSNNGKAGVAFRAAAVHPAQQSRAA
jgi:hypothetical protein